MTKLILRHRYPAGMTRFDLTLKMTDADGTESGENFSVETKDRPDADSLHRVFHVLRTELGVTVAIKPHPGTTSGRAPG
jgi:hypothetical protein